LEGDISRTNPLIPGNGDGRLDGDDLTWYDLFANGIRCPQTSPFNEFQRMDVAPFATGGDGALGADRSQIELFIAGITPRTAAGGPLAPNTPFCTGVETDEPYLRAAPADPSIIRSFRIGSVTAQSGSTVELPIEADLAGDEVTAQFTIHFDPSMLSISDIAGVNTAGLNINPDVLLGDLPEGTRVIINTTRLSEGDLGLVINFNGRGTYPAATARPGTRTLVMLKLHFVKEVKIGSIAPLNFNDSVFETKASDTLGQPLVISEDTQGGGVFGVVSNR
jgi:hypothetical protein